MWIWISVSHGTGSHDACSTPSSLSIYELQNPYPWHTPTYITISVCLPSLPFPSLGSIQSTCACRAKLLPHLPKSNPLPFFFHLHAHFLSLSLSFLGAVLIALLLWSSRSRGGRRRRRREEMADGSSNSSASVAMGQEVQVPALLCSTYSPAKPWCPSEFITHCTCLLKWMDRDSR